MDYNLSTTWTVIILIGVVWELVWKGAALWKAARNNQPTWFIALCLINSIGALPIIYLLTHRNATDHNTDSAPQELSSNTNALGQNPRSQ